MANTWLQKQVSLYWVDHSNKQTKNWAPIKCLSLFLINYIKTGIIPAIMIQNMFSVVRKLKVGKFDLLALFYSDILFPFSKKLKLKLLFFDFPLDSSSLNYFHLEKQSLTYLNLTSPLHCSCIISLSWVCVASLDTHSPKWQR